MNLQNYRTIFQTPAMVMLLVASAGCAGATRTATKAEQSSAIATIEPAESRNQPQADIATGVQCQTDVASEGAVVETLTTILRNAQSDHQEPPGIRAAGALRAYGTPNPWQGVHPDVLPALLRCASKMGMMTELGAACADSLKEIGESTISVLLPKVSGDDPDPMAFAIYAEVLPRKRIGELVPHYLAACERQASRKEGQKDSRHRDEHIVNDCFRALRKHRSQELEHAIRDYQAKNQSERSCLKRATTELNRKL